MPEATYRWGVSHLNAGEYEEAAKIFRTLLQDKSQISFDFDLVRLYLSYCYIRLDNISEARKVAGTLIRGPGLSEPVLSVGMALAERLAGPGREREIVFILDQLYRLTDGAEEHRLLVTKFQELVPGLGGRFVLSLLEEGRMPEPEHGILFPWLNRLIETGRTVRVKNIIGTLAEYKGETNFRYRIESLLRRAETIGEQTEVNIGVLLPLSGNYKLFGQTILQAFNLARDKNRDLNVNLLVRDTAGDPELGRLAAIEMIELDGVAAVLGPVISSVAENVIEVSKEKKTAFLSPAAQLPGLPALSPYFFRNSLTLQQQAEEMARTAINRLGLTKFAILSPNDNYGKALSQAFWDEVLALGGTVLYSAEYGMDQTDFSREIKLIREEDDIEVTEQDEESEEVEEINYQPPYEAVYIPDTYNRVGLIAPQLSFHDIDSEEVIILGSSGLNAPDFIRIGEDYVENSIFLDGFFIGRQNRAALDFAVRYSSRYDEEPNLLAAQAYDAANIIFSLVRRGLYEPEEIRYGLASLEDYPGVCGRTSMDSDGENIRSPVLITVFHGRLVELHIDGME